MYRFSLYYPTILYFKISARYASDDELRLFHSDAHLQYLKDLVEGEINDVKAQCCKNDIYVNENSLEVARLAAGSAIQLTSDIIQGKIQNGMCVTRPPGHHAMKSKPNGFCLCNNVGIAAKYALSNSYRIKSHDDGNRDQKLGSDSASKEDLSSTYPVRRVLIVDFDVHHGQGTQYAFYDDPNVLYFSVHRYENGLFWPNLRESDFDSVGEGNGVGYNANLPLNSVGMSDFDYMSIFHQILLPVAYEFQPDLILVEAGYDASIGDPEGQMRLSPAAYGHIIHSLMALASGRIGIFLEGGYFLESLAEGAAMTLRALLGDCNISLGPPSSPHDTLITSVLNLKYALKPYWNNLRIQAECDKNTEDVCADQNENTQRLHLPSVVYKEVSIKEDKWFSGIYDPNDHYNKHTPEKEKAFAEEISKIRQHHNNMLERHRLIKPKRLALAFDTNMMAHTNTEDNNHPEKPKRIEQIFQTHQDYGLLSRTEQGIS